MLQIGQVATRVGLSLRTLRHWDDVGLVVPSARSAGGFRLYTEDDVELLLFVKSLKPLELPLDQIGDLVRLITAVRNGTYEPAPLHGDHAGNDDEEHNEAAAADARNRLALFRAAAEARLEALRAQVDGLESLSRELKALSVSTMRARPPARHE